MSLELWTAYRYGSQFNQPETKLEDKLTEAQAAEWLRAGHGKLLHTLLVIDGEQATRANKWLAAYEKGRK